MIENQQAVQEVKDAWLELDLARMAPRSWKAVSEAVKDVFSDTMHARDIMERIRQSSSDRWRAELAIFLIGYTYCEDSNLVQTLVYHAHLLHWLSRSMGTEFKLLKKGSVRLVCAFQPIFAKPMMRLSTTFRSEVSHLNRSALDFQVAALR